MFSTIRRLFSIAAPTVLAYACDVISDQVMGEADDQVMLVGCKLASEALAWAIEALSCL